MIHQWGATESDSQIVYIKKTPRHSKLSVMSEQPQLAQTPHMSRRIVIVPQQPSVQDSTAPHKY